jgi:hypothetical protein
MMTYHKGHPCIHAIALPTSFVLFSPWPQGSLLLLKKLLTKIHPISSNVDQINYLFLFNRFEKLPIFETRENNDLL